MVTTELHLLQRELAAVCAANRPGSTTPHVVVCLPSYNVSASLLDHYGARLAALEHRYLLAALMLGRIPGAEVIFVTCERPAASVIDYYFGLLPADVRADARARFTVLEVSGREAKPVAAKLLAEPERLAWLRGHIAGRPCVIEPWNVEAEEVSVALALGAPINGTTPDLRPLGFKSEGRRLFRTAGVPIPYGVEDVRTLDDVSAAIDVIRAARPAAAGVVVKLDDSAAGDGNIIVRFDGGNDVGAALASAPAWYVDDLASGGAVEELITGACFTSPSVQLDLEAVGAVTVLATHEQMLGGDNGQVFLGCRFPADPGYALALAEHGLAIGRELVKRGVVGRVAVEFAAAQDAAGGWQVFALEMNLRKGGTTHPYSVLRHLVPGRYDPAQGRWLGEDEQSRYYVCSDNLLEPAWRGMSEAQAIAAVESAGLSFDAARRSGVVLHMLAGLAIDGRIGATAIGRTPAESDRQLAAVSEALSAAATSVGV